MARHVKLEGVHEKVCAEVDRMLDQYSRDARLRDMGFQNEKEAGE